MSNYQLAEGQRVFAYVVVEVISSAPDAQLPIGKIILETKGKGDSAQYTQPRGASDDFTTWHAAKAGRGTVRNGQAVWDQATLFEINRLREAVTVRPAGRTVFVG